MKGVSQERLHAIFHLDNSTGLLFWKERGPETMPDDRARISFNNQHAGHVAGSVKSRGWMEVSIDDKSYRVHHVVFAIANGYWPQKPIDHINHVRSDNRPENLREASYSENNKNRGPDKRNRTGACGVFPVPSGRFRAFLGTGEGRNLGTFDTVEDAVIARETEMRRRGYHPNHGKVVS